jgi:hypothetical protein
MDPAFEPPFRRRPSSRLTSYVLAAVFLGIASAVVERTVARARTYPSVLTPPATTPFTDPTERSRRLHDVIGTFATGTEPGDRVIVVQGDGHVRFYPVGPLQPALELSDTYELARRGNHTWLVTRRSGAIEVLDIDRISYFDDEYARDE